MLTVYGIPNCNTVKKALDFLKAKNVDYAFHNFKKSGISRDKLEEWMQQVPLEKLINKKGTTYKKLSDDDKELLNSPITAVELIQNHTSVIKRPILEDQKIVAMGFEEETYQKMF